MIRICRAVALAVALLAAAAADGQQYGQWSWSAAIGADHRAWDSRASEETVRDYADRILRFNLGMRGFVVDPLIGEFDVGVDSALNEVSEGLDSESIGYRGRLRILPRSAWPVELYLRKRVWDSSTPESADPLAAVGLTSDSTSWGGRALVRSGPLGGTALSIDRARERREGARNVDDRQDRESLSWSRGSGAWQHHASFQHAVRTYGMFDYRYEDLTAAFIERAEPSDRTRFDLDGSVYDRTNELGITETASRTWRLGTHLTHQLSPKTRIAGFYDFGGVDADPGSFVESHRLGTRYERRMSDELSISSFAAWGWRRGDGLDLRAPEIGVQSTWVRSFAASDVSLSGSVSRIDATLTRDHESLGSSSLGLAAAGSFSHNGTVLQQRLEVSFSHNEFDSAGDPIPQLPDLGVGYVGSGLANSMRVRGSLGRRLGLCSLDGWLEWQDRESAGPDSISRYDARGLTASIQARFPRAAIGSFATSTELRAAGEPQKVRSVSLALAWTVRGSLSLTSNWTTSLTELTLGPDVDRDRIEAGLQFGLGRLTLEVRAFEMHERGSIDRIDRGSTASIRRTFGGWLPIVSAPERRGVIR